jgi:small subunit ribosomal protein S17
MNEEVMNSQNSEQQNETQIAGVKRAKRRERVGKVTSNKMQKSITVIVEKRVKHPMYKKYYNKTTKFMAHDEKNECNIGDTVKIMETKPYSKNKRWRLVEVIEKAK